MVFRSGRFILLALIILIASVSAQSDDWFTYRHDSKRSGSSSLNIPPPLIKVRAFACGELLDNEAAVQGNFAYAGTNGLSCLNLTNGVTEWTIPFDSKISTTPLVLKDKILVGSEDGTIICINPDTSRTLWKIEKLGKIVKGFCFNKGVAYFTTTLGIIGALKLDGSFLFKITNKYPISCAPALSDGKLIVGDDKGVIHCLNADSGKPIWTTEGKSTDIIGGFNILDGRVFYGSFDNYIYCISFDDGKPVWQRRVDGWVQSPPVVIDGIVYFQIRHTKLLGYDINTGEKRCEYEYQPSKAEMIATGKTIFIGSNRRIEALTTCEMQETWHFEFSDEQITSLSIGGTYVLIGTSLGRIYQFKAGPSLDVAPKKIDIDVLTTQGDTDFQFTVMNTRTDDWPTMLEGDISTDASWLYLPEPLFKIPTGGSVDVKAMIVRQELKNPGSYTTELVVSSNGGSYKIPVSLHLIDPNPPKLCVDQTSIDMGAIQGGTIKKCMIKVTNCGKGMLRLTIGTKTFGDWLVANRVTADITEGSTEDITLIARGDRMTTVPGEDCTYSGVLSLATNVDPEPISVPVKIRCYGIPIPTNIRIQIGNENVLVNGNTVNFKPASYINSSRTMVPLRLIGEAFFAQVNWYEDTKTITISSCTTQSRFTIGSKIAEIITHDGILEKQIDVPPEIKNGRTFIPIRAVSDILGGKTSWENDTKTVVITYEP